MPDLYADITHADPAVQDRLAGVLELRAADPRMREMLDAYVADMHLEQNTRVLEAGCGTGAVCRRLAEHPQVGQVVGVDPSSLFLARARDLAEGLTGVSFQQADARSLPFADGSFDAVVFHTALCHIPGPERALAEAHRVLRPGGRLAVFDGDYTTTSLATGDCDPLQACADAAMQTLIHDRWLVRRLPSLLREVGFSAGSTRSYGLLQTTEPAYMLSIADRGADALVAWGRISKETGEALKAEARRRIEMAAFFGYIAYASVVSRKNPGPRPVSDR